MMLTQERLKQVIQYNLTTGVFTWRTPTAKWIKKNSVAGYKHHSGYIHIKIDEKNYLAHRLAFLYVEGVFPISCVDHMNGDPGDNRWCNIRHTNLSQNQANSKKRRDNISGTKGVYLINNGPKKYVAQIRHKGVCYYLGVFKTVNEASQAYKEKAVSLFGEFTNCEEGNI